MGGLGFLLGGSLLGYTDVVVQWTYFGFCLKLDGSSCYFEIMRLSESMTSLVKTVSSTNPWVQLFVCLIHLIYIIYWFVNSSSQIIFNSRMYSQGCINPLGHNSLSELLVSSLKRSQAISFEEFAYLSSRHFQPSFTLFNPTLRLRTSDISAAKIILLMSRSSCFQAEYSG